MTGSPEGSEQKVRTRYDPGLVSVIIPTFNRWDALSVCLESVEQQSYEPLEVIVVDDASTIPPPDVGLRTRRLVVLRLPRNCGPGHARNRGYIESHGEFLHFLDSDATFASPDAVGEAVAFLRGRPDVGAVGGEIPAGSGASPVSGVLGRRIGPLGRSSAVRVSPDEHLGTTAVERCDYVASCNLFVRREHFELAGGFDPYFGFGGEDLEFCWRIAQLGLGIYAGQRFAVYHHYAPEGRFSDVHYRYDLTRMRYVFKTGSLLSRCLVVAAAVAKAAAFYPLLPVKLACYAAMRRRIERGHLNSGALLAKAVCRALWELPGTLERRGRDFLCLEEIGRFERALEDATWVL